MYNINLKDYELVKIDSVGIEKNEDNILFYDIEVEDDNTFFIVNENDECYLTHNCDGYHIKGLLINIFETFFPELLTMNFLYEFVSPIIIATQGKRRKMFYKLNDYSKWINETENVSSYNIKYYKGLGTLGPQLGKELFKDLDKHLIPFHYTNPDKTKDLIDLAFNKKRPDDRKEWLSKYVLNSVFDKFAQKTTYESFMDNEFIEFSMEDNVRSIPSVVDGLKPSQRKILYTMLKLNKGEMNVGELFGYVKATAEYHHGPASLEQGIIGMAQDYVGSNNLSLLEPIGSFGTRISGGKDAAAARYIYTKLRDITKDMFMKEDSDILNYLNVDGKFVEPEYYVPIVPTVLLNGVEGIGTGWSSTIPKFKIEDLIEYIINKINNKRNNIELNPYYEKFIGEVYHDKEGDNCVTKGILERINTSTLLIKELPINVWNDNYYVFLEDELLDKKLIKSYEKNCTDEKVSIRVKMQRELLETFSDSDLYSMFQLESKVNMSNMHLFNSNGKIKKYGSQYEIIDEFYDVRLEHYQKRKDFVLNKLRNKKVWFDNTIKFIKLVIKGDIKINNVSITNIIKSLNDNGIVEIDGSYNYLLNIPIYKLTKEELVKLRDDYNHLKETLKILEEKTPQNLWYEDLLKLKNSIKKYRNHKY